ncbi:protein of unknown function DUF881 [Alkaliphilus metalliredigens QYMF]|uniref:Division initiation protein n=1 Tax=Alkaliphilus metalliredigens (strain QYMF) TaxID=293826 RepID=A6TS57_ALKMQ|nr:DUF881 domain-containing protein [Alkaliphilus metalliredigens]ABR49025.1 protein of unknown function DUF881 [Alkaliphilus metalliredigens QYMF]
MKMANKSWIIIFTFFLFGFGLTFQWKNADAEYEHVDIRTISDLQNAVKTELERTNNLRALVVQSENRLNEYEQAIADGKGIQDILEAEIDNMMLTSGMIDLEGPGVTVRMTDSERDLYEGEEPNDVVIHEADVLGIVNDLKIAGAEAISINGQILTSKSEIICTGPTITINGYTYGQPFVIRAIGDTQTLAAAVRAPGTTAINLRDIWGLGIETQVSERVRIAKFQGSTQFNYAIPKEGE